MEHPLAVLAAHSLLWTAIATPSPANWSAGAVRRALGRRDPLGLGPGPAPGGSRTERRWRLSAACFGRVLASAASGSWAGSIDGLRSDQAIGAGSRLQGGTSTFVNAEVASGWLSSARYVPRGTASMIVSHRGLKKLGEPIGCVLVEDELVPEAVRACLDARTPLLERGAPGAWWRPPPDRDVAARVDAAAVMLARPRLRAHEPTIPVRLHSWRVRVGGRGRARSAAPSRGPS